MENIGVGNNSFNAQVAATSAAAPKAQIRQDLPVEKVAETKDTSEAFVEPKDQEQAKLQAVKRAASAVATTFAVSDTRFTIYKESSAGGTVFVTRFTSLRDGEVTTVREPELLANFGKESGTILTALA